MTPRSRSRVLNELEMRVKLADLDMGSLPTEGVRVQDAQVAIFQGFILGLKFAIDLLKIPEEAAPPPVVVPPAPPVEVTTKTVTKTLTLNGRTLKVPSLEPVS